MRISPSAMTKSRRVRISKPSRDDLWAKAGAAYPSALALLWPLNPTLVGVQKSAVGPDPVWSYTGPQYDADGTSLGAVPAVQGDKGVWCGPGYSNLFAGDPSTARSVALTAQVYTLWCADGSVSCSYGTATPSSPLKFTATAGNTTFTPTGVTKWQLTATLVPMPYVPPGTTVASAAGTSGGNGLAWEMDAQMLAALSGKCTIVTLTTMGVGSGDLPNNTTVPIISANTATFATQFFRKGTTGANAIAMSSDGTANTDASGSMLYAWQRDDIVLRVTPVNKEGTQFRAGYAVKGVHTAIQSSQWANYDGSFNALTHLRAALNNINSPFWLKGVQIWDAPEVSDADIEKQFKAVGVL